MKKLDTNPAFVAFVKQATSVTAEALQERIATLAPPELYDHSMDTQGASRRRCQQL
jgi:hypothetical protein